MKYQLINKQTGEQTLCDKVTIDGFDYYVSNGQPNINDFSFNTKYEWIKEVDKNYLLFVNYEDKKVMATTNPNLDIPQVVDEVETLAREATKIYINEREKQTVYLEFMNGYNKSQETHSFSEEDADAYADAVMGGCLLRAKEWKLQQPKKVYYEK
jgi:hypothetical protein